MSLIKHVFLYLTLAAFLFLLCACGAAPAPAQTVEETEPAVITIGETELSPDAQELRFDSESQLQEFLRYRDAFPALHDLSYQGEMTPALLAQLREALPAVQLHYSVPLAGQTLSSDVSTLDLSSLEDGQIASAAQALALLPQLQEVKLAETVPAETYAALKKAAPNAHFDCSFDLFGQTVTPDTEMLLYSNVPIGNEGVIQFIKVLPYLDKLQELRVEYCGISDWAMAELRDTFPEKNIVWRVVCGWANDWSDTDTVWYIGGFSDAQLFPLRYDTKVKYLDLGHNGIYSLDFVRYMPDLEVFIIENDFVSDLRAMATCRNIEFLEVGETQVTDVSPLAACTSLEHLNIGGLLGLTDISPLYELPNLKRLYGLCDVNVPQEQVETITELMPNTEVAFHYDPKGAVNGYHWRYAEGGGLVPRYQLLHDQLGYNW